MFLYCVHYLSLFYKSQAGAHITSLRDAFNKNRECNADEIRWKLNWVLQGAEVPDHIPPQQS